MSKRTLLLADDSVTIQKVVNLTFADEGIDVITVGDGDTAMQKIYEIGPDVVLADVHMPGLNGYQICEILRENPATYKLPVVLLVGSFEPFDESEAARVGANAYLTKPFQSIRQLVSQVTDLIQSSSPESEQPEAEYHEPAADEYAEPQKNVPDTTDIDSLYQQSFGTESSSEMHASSGYETESAPAPASDQSYGGFADHGYSQPQTDAAPTPSPFVDAGMDDEMIETSHVGAVEQPEETSESGWSISDYQADVQHADSVPVESEYTTEQQYAGVNASAESEYTTEPQYAEMNATAEQITYEETPQTDWAPQEEQSLSHGAFDSYAEDRSPEPDANEGFDEFSRTEQMPPSISASSLNLDDLNILDLPPLPNANTQEFSTAPRPESEGGGKEIVSLSPELMDQLVQRVVEKLSKDK